MFRYPTLADRLLRSVESYMHYLEGASEGVNSHGELDGLVQALCRSSTLRCGIVGARIDDIVVRWLAHPASLSPVCPVEIQYSDAISRAAFNREWLAASGLPRTNTTVVAFSWPSSGSVVGFPILVAPYLADQNMARNSGLAVMSFLANLDPIIRAARRSGARVTLLAHSMGNLALQSGVENWFLNGNGAELFFDLTVLAAADCRYDVFDHPSPTGLSGLTQLSERIAPGVATEHGCESGRQAPRAGWAA